MEEKVWYYAKEGEQLGPITETDMRGLLASGQLSPEAMIWKQGMGNWAPARSIHALWGAASPEGDGGTVPPAPAGMPQVGGETNGMAIASLVLGILSFAMCGCMTAIPGIVCGHMALGQIKREPERYKGRELAIVGLVLSYIALVLSFLIIPFLFLGAFVG